MFTQATGQHPLRRKTAQMKIHLGENSLHSASLKSTLVNQKIDILSTQPPTHLFTIIFPGTNLKKFPALQPSIAI
jgi:hypothetical protein